RSVLLVELEEVDGRVGQADRDGSARATPAIAGLCAQHLGVEALGTIDVAGHQGPVVDAFDGWCLCRDCHADPPHCSVNAGASRTLSGFAVGCRAPVLIMAARWTTLLCRRPSPSRATAWCASSGSCAAWW